MVCSVLSTIPVYHMLCFLLPVWVIARIDKARRTFLWGNSRTVGRGISLCNWPLACTPKKWGGLGLPNLRLWNISLILRWWWKGYKQPDSIWSLIIYQTRCQGIHIQGPLIWSKQGSFFWGQLVKLKRIFDWSITWTIGNGQDISFWFDKWDGEVLAPFGSRQIRAAMPLSVAHEEGLVRDNIILTDSQDELSWRWSSSGDYTARSLYQVLSGGGKIRWAFTSTWKYRVPPTVKAFILMLLQGKILTRDVLHRRQFNCPDLTCALCANDQFETTAHIFFQCDFAMQVWRKVAIHLGAPIMISTNVVTETWRLSAAIPSSTRAKARWATFFVCTVWGIWKQRNKRIFEGQRDSANIVAEWIIQEATLWERYCGSHIRR